MFAGLENGLFVLIHRQMMQEFLGPSASEVLITQWFAWNQAAFMGGAAVGGWIFGWLGDSLGRSRSLGWSVLCYSVGSLACWFATDPAVMWVLRFLSCLGFGGCWPNAVALVAEAYPSASRPFLSGLLGTAANVGFVLLGTLGYWIPVTQESWRWTLLVGASPSVLGLLIVWKLPESVAWLRARQKWETQVKANRGGKSGKGSAFASLWKPPLLQRTLIGIALGSIPVVGTAANANWVVPWTDQIAAKKQAIQGSVANKTPETPQQSSQKKAWTLITRSSGAVLGSLGGGILASFVGRKWSYFLISLATFGISCYLFGRLDPDQPGFQVAVFFLGLFGVTYFGWLPLFLPELFPTRVRSTGSGISFNSGRIIAAAVVVFVGIRMTEFAGDYALIGFWTGWIYFLGMVVIWLAPTPELEKEAPSHVVPKPG